MGFWMGEVVQVAKVEERKDALKLTRRRKIVLDVLKKHGHLDAYELLEHARKIDPRISLSTIYRALSYFKKEEIVAERSFGENHSHYEMINAHEGSHAHIICTLCGSVSEISGNFLDSLEKAAEKKGYKVSHTHVDIFGICPKCKKS